MKKKELKDMTASEIFEMYQKFKKENPDKVESFDARAELAKWDEIKKEMAAEGIELEKAILDTDSLEEKAKKLGHNAKVAAKQVLSEKKSS